ncbi:MAG: mercuric reductase [Calditrichaeota bacterium]|nr:mercuric reductase [Calditrichota bacterium]MCB9365648.1 mercuric reductase [Calditrichota bacterium]
MSFPANKLIWPEDAHNLTLLSQVHPQNYVNPVPSGRYNLVVIGGGTAGLVTAAGAAGLGAKVALIEKHLLGGDCLNTGCVPSKALIRAARAAAEIRDAAQLGIDVPTYKVNFFEVMSRVRKLRARISPTDGVDALIRKGVDVYLGEGRFVDSQTIEVGDRKLNFSRAVIASGARAAIPNIPGLAEIEPLTSETVFWLTELPRRLAVIGAGPIGVELAQAFACLGSVVTLYDVQERILSREDPDASDIVRRSLERDGVRLRPGVSGMSCALEETNKVIRCDVGGQQAEDFFDHVLIGAGRTPNTEGMNLDAVHVEHDRTGVRVNDYLRTTNSRIYACGDVASSYKFTHAADALARVVIGNALFFGTHKASELNIPWAIYSSPEVAQVGAQAQDDAAQSYRTIRIDLDDLDRAILDETDEGFIKVLHDRRGQIKGATIVSEHAGELIGEIVVAMNHRVSLNSLASAIHPYPTQSEMIKKCGDMYRRTMLTPTVAKMLNTILKWRR